MYEIEVKSLLGEQKYADDFRAKLLDAGAREKGRNQQLNHYFHGQPDGLFDRVKDFVGDQVDHLKHIFDNGREHSVRTRKKDDEVLLVVKASIDEGTSANAVSRMEFEAPVSLSIDELDELVRGAGLDYQAKWSRYREEYDYDDLAVTLDRNAGYGWLTEFEKVVNDEGEAPQARVDILTRMQHFGLEELPQDRLERMFAYYNENWPHYYGTDRVFVIE